MATAASRRSNASRKALWVVAAGIAAALLASLAILGFRDPEPDPRRVAVGEYVGEVNVVQQGLSARMTNVAAAYAAFRKGTGLDVLLPKLREAEVTLAELERRVRALDAPADADGADALDAEVIEAALHGPTLGIEDARLGQDVDGESMAAHRAMTSSLR